MSDRAITAPRAGWSELGTEIRARRHRLGLTLVSLAQRCELSQPFLSQVENGRAAPSMESLARIAAALDTTPQALFSGPGAVADDPVVVRRTDESVVVLDRGPESIVRLVLPGDGPFRVLEFHGLPEQFAETWEHHGFEAVYVIDGAVEMQVGDEIIRLASGDFLSYSPDRPHRLRALDATVPRVLMIESAGVHDPAGSAHTGSDGVPPMAPQSGS